MSRYLLSQCEQCHTSTALILVVIAAGPTMSRAVPWVEQRLCLPCRNTPLAGGAR